MITYEATDNSGNVSTVGSLAFWLFEANETGLSDLTEYFQDQQLIDSTVGIGLAAWA